MVQIPRLYDVCKKLGEVVCFQVIIAAKNIDSNSNNVIPHVK